MPGTFWKRFVAYFIDALIMAAVLFIPNLIIKIVLGVLMGASLPTDSDGNLNPAYLILSGIQAVIGIVLAIAAYFVYFGFLESSASQASFGKQIFGLKVTKDDGSKLTFAAAGSRGAIKYLAILFTCCIGGFMALFTDRAKTLHDMICGTVVVEPMQ